MLGLHDSILAGLAIWIGVASLITAAIYWRDKRAAMAERRRTPETTMLAWSLVGGWPGGLIAGRMLRHKTFKRSYRLKFTGCVMLNLVIVAILIWAVV